MTKIPWTDESWNPITGCDKVSDGCKNCYAEGIAKRFWKDRKFGDVQFHPDRLNIPSKWKKPRKIFVCSMGDLFHEDVTIGWIQAIFQVIHDNPKHIFIILSKRPQNFLRCINRFKVMPNIWLGVSVENQEQANKRILELLKIPAAVRFVSVEPMLGTIDLSQWINKLDWVIIGCESGNKRRSEPPDGVGRLMKQCIGAKLPIFVKQISVNGKIYKMPKIDGRVWDEFPGGEG